ncbi:MAG: TRAP transporter large permease [Deltaproteobacteria bacterium]|nr:TRAP transporter large permease [Deltaproteobacteria bacterium]
MDLALLLLFLFAFMALGVPVAFSMGLASTAFILVHPGQIPLEVLPQRMLSGLDSFSLLAIPFFYLAGELMNEGGITQRLVNVATAFVGHFRGGLSHVVVVSNMLMAGVSGSSVADAAATGSVLIPAMKRAGFGAPYASALTAAAGTIGPIIPPSLPMLVLGILANISIGKLFLGGAVPGAVMGLYLMGTSYLVSRRRGYATSPRVVWSERFRALWEALFALLMPLLVLGGIVAGLMTATEAGAIAALYALVVGLFVYRGMGFRDIPRVFGRAAAGSAVMLLILSASYVFGWLLANMRVADAIVATVQSISTSPWVTLLVINVFFLAWGCVLDPVPALIILVPMFVPLVQKVGVDPVHFGVMVVLNLQIGLLTPPVGFLVYLTSSIGNARVGETFRESTPFILALAVVLLLVTYYPPLVLWLPTRLMGN